MDKCKKCEYRSEYYYGENLTNLYEYCGLIESICEDAIDINEIEECPKDLITKKYKHKRMFDNE